MNHRTRGITACKQAAHDDAVRQHVLRRIDRTRHRLRDYSAA